MEQLLEKILEKLKKTPDVQVFRDLYYMCLECTPRHERNAKKSSQSW